MTDAEILRAALSFLGWKPSDLTRLLQLEGTHDRSTTHRWLSGATPVPSQLKLLLKQHVLDTLPSAQKPSKTKMIMVCGTDGGVGVSPFAVTLAHLLCEFGLRADCYHAGRDPIDVRWSLRSSLFRKPSGGRSSKQENYLSELNVLLSDAGRGVLDLDCLVIDVSRRLENTEHYSNTIYAADAAIVLTRDWDSLRMRIFDKIKATGTPVKALVKLHGGSLYELSTIMQMPSDTNIDEVGSTFFKAILIDSRLRADVDDYSHHQTELRTPPEQRISPLMLACTEVVLETLEMLKLKFIESIEVGLNEHRPLTLEAVIRQVCAELPGVTAARNVTLSKKYCDWAV